MISPIIWCKHLDLYVFLIGLLLLYPIGLGLLWFHFLLILGFFYSFFISLMLYSVVCCLISVFSKGSISLWWDRIHDTFIFAIYFENYIVSNLTCNFENVLWAFSKKECDVICFSRFFSFGLYANSSLVVLVSH